MGDTCSLNLRFARKDLEKFNEVLKDEIWNGTFWDEDQGDDEEVMAIIYEANYGWNNQLEKLVIASLTFIAEHSAGSEYGPMAFACYQGDYTEISIDVGSTPMVAAPNGCVDEVGLDIIRKYYKILDKIGGDTK